MTDEIERQCRYCSCWGFIDRKGITPAVYAGMLVGFLLGYAILGSSSVTVEDRDGDGKPDVVIKNRFGLEDVFYSREGKYIGASELNSQKCNPAEKGERK